MFFVGLRSGELPVTPLGAGLDRFLDAGNLAALRLFVTNMSRWPIRRSRRWSQPAVAHRILRTWPLNALTGYVKTPRVTHSAADIRPHAPPEAETRPCSDECRGAATQVPPQRASGN